MTPRFLHFISPGASPARLVREAADAIAADTRGFSALRLLELEFLRVPRNHRRHAHEGFAGDDCFVANRGIHAEEAERLDRAAPGDYNVRGDGDVILDHRVMPDVVAAPHHDIVADADKRLDRVVL